MKMRISQFLAPFMKRLGHSRDSFHRDRELLNKFMDNVYRVPAEIQSQTEIKKLSKSRSIIVNPKLTNNKRALFYLHGGAMCLSLWKFYLPFVHKLATETNATVFMPDYRLAPEYPFPNGLDDCLEAFDALCETSGFESAVVVGDSAGGNLAFNVARHRCDRVRGLCLLSPWLDLTHTSIFFDRNKSDEVVYRESANRAAWLYVMGERDWTFGAEKPSLNQEFSERVRDPLVSPAFASLEQLSRKPILIQASATERLVGDSIGLLRRLGAELKHEDILFNHKSVLRYGVGEHRLTLWPDEPHCWQITRPKSVSAQDSLTEIAAFCNKLFESPHIISD